MIVLGREAIRAIEAILNNHGEAAVKRERDSIVVIDINRKVKCKESVLIDE